MLQLKCGRVAGGHLSSPRGAGWPSLVMALPCALGSELIRYFATGGGKKNNNPVFKALFPWGKASLVRNVRAEMSSDPATGSRLPGGPAASPAHVPVPLLEEASPSAAFGRLWPLPSPGRLHHPPPASFICLCPSAAVVHPIGVLGGSGTVRWPGMAAPSRVSSRPPARSSRGEEGRSHPVSCKYLSLFPLES